MNNSTSSFICVIYNNATAYKYDEAQCMIGNFAATLYKYDFGYFCMGPLGIMIFISIFGGIKQNYRWFILHQAIWDLIKSYEFSCDNYLENYVKISSGCFFYFNKGLGPWDTTIHEFIVNNIFAPLLLLSITRFIALYFTKFYTKLTKGYRIIFGIIFFNIFFMIWDTEVLINEIRSARVKSLQSECQIKETLNSSTLCTTFFIGRYSNDFIVTFLFSIYSIFVTLSNLKPAIFLLLSTFSTVMIIFKIGMQAKFQLKHNRRDFLNSVRVAVVVASQTVMNFLIFILYFFGNITSFIAIFTSTPILTTKNNVEGKNYTGYIDFRLPLWIDGRMGLTSLGGQQMITQIRIFIESFIVLCIMTGYREAIAKVLQNLYFLIQNPRKFIRSFKKTSPQNSWT